MSTVVDSPYMGLPVPVALSTPGPEWAVDINACLALIDAHNHSTGQGVPVTPSGLNINADLTFQQHNVLLPRSIRFYQNAAALALAADLRCAYVTGSDLYYNDGSGNQIRITQSGSVAGGSGTITGLPSGTASAAYISGTGTFQFLQATSTAANIDVASVAIRYPGSYPTPSGNYIQLEAPSSLASGYSLTLPSLPAQTNVMTLGTAGAISSITYDSVGQNMTSVGANAIASSMTSTGANTIAATMTSTGTGSIAATMTNGDVNVIAGKMTGSITATAIAAGTILGANMANNVDLPGNSNRANGHNILGSLINATYELCLIRCWFDSSGALISGEGATCSNTGTGLYTVTFGGTFTDTPVVMVCPNEPTGSNKIVTVNGTTTTTCAIKTATNSALSNSGFSIIVIGQKA